MSCGKGICSVTLLPRGWSRAGWVDGTHEEYNNFDIGIDFMNFTNNVFWEKKSENETSPVIVSIERA